MPQEPGVYRMLSDTGEVLYVGKAKNLKKRVTSYTRLTSLSTRIARMVGETRSMMIVTTHTEAEALLLEANLIKRLKPRFNIILRDDKSFPYIHLRDDHSWPQIVKHRGARKEKGLYFGPFASASAVNRTLNTLQRVFLLRSCSDSVLESRTRPCLLYQIKRCSAPCVGEISKENYDFLVKEAKEFLSGKTANIQKRLATAMQKASDSLEYEKAAAIRDRLRALTQVQSHQNINLHAIGNADLIALYQAGGQTSIQVFFFRAGQNWGNRSYFPRHQSHEKPESIMGAFIAQFYDNKPPPPEIIVNITPESRSLLEEAFSTRAGHKIKVTKPQRGQKKNLLETALENAKGALARKLAESASQQKLLQGLTKIFDLPEPPRRIEVYDNSHIQGKDPVGAMIAAGPEGFIKNSYRKFNIRWKNTEPGDDYAMMREVMTRRFSRLQKEDPNNEKENWPDLILIDGGKGQLNAVKQVMDDLGIDNVALVAVSKGPDRNAGREQFHMPGQKSFTLPPSHPSLFFLQRLRDEAHRFAIGTHRARRQKRTYASPLDGIPGIGPKRKKALLHHFGSAKEVANAGVRDLETVEGVNQKMAETIYDYFHDANK